MSKKERASMSREIQAKATRKIKAKSKDAPGIWSGLGMMGLIGWSVTVPTLLGAALGFWLDRRFPGSYSWTLSLLIIGLAVGCLNAWHWVGKEAEEMKAESEDTDD